MKILASAASVLALSFALIGCKAPSASKPAAEGGATSGALAATQLDPNAVVAKVHGEPITGKQLDEAIKKELQSAEKEYVTRVTQLRKQSLEQMIARKLVEERAKKESMPPEALVKREVMDKIPDPPEAELKKFYDERSSKGQQLPPYEQIKPQIAQFMKQDKIGDGMQKFIEGLKKEAGVEMSLPVYEEPRIQVAAEGPSKGPANAPVTIVEFSDFQCPFCGRALPTVERVMKEYEGKVRLVYRDYPLPFHDKAMKASEAALCAQDQGKYWEMHEKLFANQKALDVPQLKGYAKDLKLDNGKFEKCLDGGEKVAMVEKNKKEGEEAGVNGTPAFFINGKLLSGAQPFEQFKETIDAELKRTH